MEAGHWPDEAIQFRSCHSVDEQAALLDTWNQSYCQLSRGLFDGSVRWFMAGGVKVLVEKLNRTVYQRGCVSEHKFALGIPFQLEGHALLSGQTSHLDALHVFSGKDGFEFLSPDQHLFVNLEIEPEAVADLATRAQLEAVIARIGAKSGIVNIAPERLERFRAVLRVLLDSVSAAPRLLADRASVASFEKSIVYGLSEALHEFPDIAPQQRGEARIARNWQLVRSVRDIVEGSPDCPLSVAELCARMHASRRTLQYAFEEATGINPLAYMRAVRLARVRQELMHAATVTEVATRWGFWHFGNFASEYREQFGELPSETWRRNRM
ncbi:helix-turn-helix domain-containing protein [Paraburkholderia sp. Ac-20340]|uniref:helix-turn-helix domain-containing protein n=1 Tax=Paraburkholderia sp. Ac-20340 TaxID=2703888 RepID=UPI00197E4822|nr:helix-turn-helix domain-containing protein [Paraburkholderia sp. Ac-20340]MBN3852300.1 helix-turn-helix domain-containing protein [Paraburkholderia sp. Ac-20340]